jgi:cysteinyl-tRNA synthetase
MIRLKQLFLLPLLLAASCGGTEGDGTDYGEVDFRQEMRDFVRRISTEAKTENAGFIIIPQNGEALIFSGDGETLTVDNDYAAAIDGQGREDLFYGYDGDGIPTSEADRAEMMPALNAEFSKGIMILVTDYCADLAGSAAQSQADLSRTAVDTLGWLVYTADHRDLDNITALYTPPEPDADDGSLAGAENFLYLINPVFDTKEDYLAALDATDYDIFIIDLFFDDGSGEPSALTEADVDRLRSRPTGGDRLVICYMSIGEAEDYRYYWNTAWDSSPPVWLEHEDPNWAGNYYVRYWDPAWQTVICDDYLVKILEAGFDGVYLDLIDAYEVFEGM